MRNLVLFTTYIYITPVFIAVSNIVSRPIPDYNARNQNIQVVLCTHYCILSIQLVHIMYNVEVLEKTEKKRMR